MLDDNGAEGVSMIEAKYFPLWGVIFHPEKVPFEETLVADESIKVCYTAHLFIFLASLGYITVSFDGHRS